MAEKKYPKAAVGVMIYNDKGEVFLAKGCKWNNKWLVPGGKIKFGETAEQALRREIKEETGLEIDDIEFVYWSENIFPVEFFAKEHFIFLSFCAKAVGNNIKLNDELQEYKWIDPMKALNLDLSNSTKRFIKEYVKLKSR